MKKTVFLALIVCGLVASFFVGTSMSQAPANENSARDVDYDDFGFDEGTVDNLVEPAADDRRKKLQGQLLRLSQQRIETMTEEQLKAEIARLSKETEERLAKSRLAEAEGILRQIVQAFPESQAAKRAKQMLQSSLPGGGGFPVPFDFQR